MSRKSENRGRSLLVTAIAIVVALVGIIPFSKAFAGSGNVMGVPFSLVINQGKTAEETLPGQKIQSSLNFDNADKTRQAVVNSPVSTDSKFDFSAVFQMQQSKFLVVAELWNALVKPDENAINVMEAKQNPGAGIKSYVDIVAQIDERITPAEKISAYFDSHTWRPTHVFDGDYNLLADVKDSYKKGESKKNFKFPSNGKKTYIVRVVPIAGENFTKEQKDAPMSFGFDEPGNNNFTVSATESNKIAAERRKMTDADIEKEKGILNKTTKLSDEEIAFLKKYNLYTGGNVKGKVTGAVRFLGEIPLSVEGRIPPAGVAVTYANPSITFMRNYNDVDSDKIATVYAEYGKSINDDALADQKMPENPTRPGYKFLGWSTDKNATEGDGIKWGDLLLTKNTTVYAVWEAITYEVNYKFVAENGSGDLPQALNDRLPTKATGKLNGVTVKPTDLQEEEKEYKDPNRHGTWKFVKWDADSKVVNGDNVTFTGTWKFVPTPLVDVTYEFKSGTKDKELPAEVEALKPNKEAAYQGTTARPTELDKKEVTTNDGTWKFVKWDIDSVEVKTENIKFTGTWEFTPKEVKKYDVTYKFETKDTDKQLPEAVTKLLPAAEQVEDGKEVVAKSINKTVKDEANDGTWTFAGWDKARETVNGANVTFTGKWTFKANTYKALHKFESITRGKKLPAAILGRVPADKKNLLNKDVVTPGDFDKADFKDENGTWVFKAWKPETVTVDKSNVYFIGTWEFKEKAAPQPKPTLFNIIHKFVSGTAGVDLDEEIMRRLPQNKTAEDGTTVNPSEFNKESVKTQKGTWSFEGWNSNSQKVSGSDVTFTGVWKFTAAKTEKPENKPEKPEIKPEKPEVKPEGPKDNSGKKPGKNEAKKPSTDKAKIKKTPKTSDNSGLELVLTVLMLSGAGIIGFTRRKSK